MLVDTIYKVDRQIFETELLTQKRENGFEVGDEIWRLHSETPADGNTGIRFDFVYSQKALASHFTV